MMALPLLIAILLAAGVLAAVAARWSATLARWICLLALAADSALALWLATLRGPGFFARFDASWIPAAGARIEFAMDGLSLPLILLTLFLGFAALLASWHEIQNSVGFFHLNLMWILAGIIGVFLALDLLLFYFFWELMLIPMFFLIIMWGHEDRVYAGIKFFLFTQLSGLLMLVAILALYFVHHQHTGVYTFDYFQLLGEPIGPAAMLIMLGFFATFGVKLPMVPLHTWLPDAHTEAPTAGSVILAGLLLKTGAYGMLRFILPLFPQQARAFAPIAMALGVVGILYGALLAFGQTDLKRLVAYTSVSHLGFVLLGIFSMTSWGFQGAILTMLCHGVSTGALFILVGALQERMHTRELDRMGGLWDTIPRFSGAALFFALASLGLPGMGDFVGEFLVLLGTYPVSVPLAVLASIGVLFATLYALRMVQRAFHGPNTHRLSLPDLSLREGLVAAAMMIALLWLGLYPQPVVDTYSQSRSNRSLTLAAPLLSRDRKGAVRQAHSEIPDYAAR